VAFCCHADLAVLGVYVSTGQANLCRLCASSLYAIGCKYKGTSRVPPSGVFLATVSYAVTTFAGCAAGVICQPCRWNQCCLHGCKYLLLELHVYAVVWPNQASMWPINMHIFCMRFCAFVAISCIVAELCTQNPAGLWVVVEALGIARLYSKGDTLLCLGTGYCIACSSACKPGMAGSLAC
jgi:hypothetical protein